MNKIRLYTLVTYYFFLFSLVYTNLKNYPIFDTMVYLLILAELFFLIIVLFKFLKEKILAISLILKQFLLVVCFFYLTEYTGGYFYVFFAVTVLLYYLLGVFHERVEPESNNFRHYHLKIKNRFLLSLTYIFYGLAAYILLYLNKADFIKIFADYSALFYFALYPYLIIVFMLITLHFNKNTDIYRQKIKYDAKRTIIKNAIINILSILFIYFD